ncbi:hypothetical protein [Cohnella candidum]|uniref:hypothetical protein n=1 Tax=Cohnella candidum TaxID=2674991 RepID=UPI0013DE1028|nr:hypothetical protein [Cohnella candidum]
MLIYVFAEIFLFRNLAFYGHEYRSFVGQFAELDVSFQHANPSAIDTVIFGDSQSKDALRPDLLAAASGRNPESIFNFSVSGGKAYEMYHNYLKYVDRLPHVKEAIIVINEHQINSYNMANDPKFRYYAGLKDRIRIMNKDNYGELALGWASKAIDLRDIWSKMVRSYFKGTLPKPLATVWQPGGLRAETEVKQENLTAAYAEKTADGWFQNYDLNGLQTESLESLLKELHSKGIKIVILQIPRSDLFEAVIKKKYAKQQQAYFNEIQYLATEYDAEFHVMSNQGLTLKEYFRDTNHLRPKGAKVVSQRIAEQWL